ncbi:DUF6350 family protein [Microbacterium sp. DT81.1]|uniref:cell division protein PerM n=1 Tax=Microbacterium sp. DT81.1 TaxID=3393413 RepID=UPI003CF09180
MDRLLVALLSAFDALLAAAVGLAVVLAPLTLVWVVALGGDADWGALWPASGSIWQLGNLVPLSITLDALYAAQTGIETDTAAFTLSLAPLAFAVFTTIFAARSGSRAAGAGAWITGVASGTLVFGVIAAAVLLTTSNPIARPTIWQAVLLPSVVYGGAALAGAVVAAWRDGDDGPIDQLRRRLDSLPHGWGEVPGLIARGTAIALAGLVMAASAAVGVSVLLRGDEVIALYESTHLDALGATVVTLGQLAYLPTLVVWALAWLAGPGFAIGVGTAVSPAGTQLGVLPGIPLLGLIPEGGSDWLLLVLLVPVAAGAVAGWAIRSRMVAPKLAAPATAVPVARVELTGLIPTVPIAPPVAPPAPEHEPVGPRIAVTAGIGILAGALAALLAWAASGSLGPGRLAEVGPSAGPVALAVGLEVLVGAAILLLGPQSKPRQRKARHAGKWWVRRARNEDRIPVAGAVHVGPDTAGEAGNPSPEVHPTAGMPSGGGLPSSAGMPSGAGLPSSAGMPSSGAVPSTPGAPSGAEVPPAADPTSTTEAPAPSGGAATADETPPEPRSARKPQSDVNPWALLSKSKAAKGRGVGEPVPATPDEKAPVD